MGIEIKQVDASDKKQLIRFFKHQNLFYRNDPNFVPPLIGGQLALVNTKRNPFYKHAKIAHFIAYNNGGISGLISAITNENHNKDNNDNVGFFGFFECDDNQEVANALITTALEWNKAQGKDGMIGPFNPSINDTIGVQISGFEDPPVIYNVYNPPYYDKLLLGAGLEKAMDLFAYDLQMKNFMSDRMESLNDKLVSRYKIEHRDIALKDKDLFPKQVEQIWELHSKSWKKNWGSVKMTREEFDKLAAELKQVAHPKLPFMTYADGKLAGVAIVVQDLNQLLISNKKQRLAGLLWRMMTKSKQINRVRILILGVLPEFQNMGIDSTIYHEIGRRAKEAGYMRGEGSWILENNEKMNRAFSQIMNADLYKKYRVYQTQKAE